MNPDTHGCPHTQTDTHRAVIPSISSLQVHCSVWELRRDLDLPPQSDSRLPLIRPFVLPVNFSPFTQRSEHLQGNSCYYNVRSKTACQWTSEVKWAVSDQLRLHVVVSPPPQDPVHSTHSHTHTCCHWSSLCSPHSRCLTWRVAEKHTDTHTPSSQPADSQTAGRKWTGSRLGMLMWRRCVVGGGALKRSAHTGSKCTVNKGSEVRAQRPPSNGLPLDQVVLSSPSRASSHTPTPPPTPQNTHHRQHEPHSEQEHRHTTPSCQLLQHKIKFE